MLIYTMNEEIENIIEKEKQDYWDGTNYNFDGSDPEDFNPVNYVDLNGGGQPHNNMPPYFALNFIIKYK